MHNPYAICIHCDGAMDYDSKQTGGNGFVIEFPDDLNLDPITRSFRNDGQGINRLEMISILEAMEELLSKKNSLPLNRASGVVIYTDRYNATDEQALNPYRIKEYRKNGWKNHEGKAIKDKEILDKIDKARTKLSQIVGGRVEIKYKKEKHNKTADKLSKIGRAGNERGRKIISKKNKQITRRQFNGPEIDYRTLTVGDVLKVRVYAWEPIQEQCEVSTEILSKRNKGEKLKVYIDLKDKAIVNRSHVYKIKVKEVFRHHVLVEYFKEIPKKPTS